MGFPRLRPSFTSIMVAMGMIAVAIALADWLGELSRWRERYQNAAENHAEKQMKLKRALKSIDALKDRDINPAPKTLAYARFIRRQVDYHADMVRKYQRAAKRPWGPFPHDPGEPANVRFKRTFDALDFPPPAKFFDKGAPLIVPQD